MRRHAESAGRAERMLGAIIVAQALTLAVSGPTSSPEYLPLRVAEAEGHFAKEGLVVTLKTTRAGLSPAQVWLVSRGDRGLQHAVETGDVHTALVREPAASRLLAAGQARLLVDLRTPAAVSQALGAATVNAAVFMRADRAVRDRDLAAFTRAVLAAERRVATATAQALSERLPTSITVPADDFEARLAGCRDLYLADGAVTVEQVRETLTVIRGHRPLPVTARVPPPEELLHVSRRVLTPPAAVR